MSGMQQLVELAASRPGADAPVEARIAWYRAKARVLSGEARFAESLGHADTAARFVAMARGAHHHAERIALEAEAARPIPSSRTTTEVI